MEDLILVTVLCLAFNHEKYIANALDGFIKQETNFKYEILVHDDASTDQTAEIIRKYERNYPKIIKGFYQRENQYTKGIDVMATVLMAHAKGKYVALCEGDDYWTDPLKLQLQVNAMENNQNCKMAVHTVAEVSRDGTKTGTMFPASKIETGIIKSREFFSIGKVYSFHTSSYMFCAIDFWQYKSEPPKFAEQCDVGDELYMLYFGQLGGVYYIDRVMSCYRRGIEGSWSAMQRNQNVELMALHHELMVNVYKEFDQYTNEQYHDIFVERIGKQMALACVMSGTAREMFQMKNIDYFGSLTNKQKSFVRLAKRYPMLMRKVYLAWRRFLDRQHGM